MGDFMPVSCFLLVGFAQVLPWWWIIRARIVLYERRSYVVLHRSKMRFPQFFWNGEATDRIRKR